MGSLDCYSARGNEVAVVSLNSLPLGFRFRPTDEELIDYYLRQKINGNGDEVWVIREIDVCKWEPWDMPDLSVVRNKDPEWFFFCPQDKKYPNGHRLNRATNQGYWKATGKDRKIKSGSSLIGMKKTLVFYTGRAPKGKRTNWVMHEYRPTLKELDGTNPGQNPYVLCRLFKKHDESLEVSNCGEVEQTASTPMAASYSPEDTQSDLAPVAVSPSQVTEDDKHLANVPAFSEEAVSNIVTPVDCHSDGFGAYHTKNQLEGEPTAEDVQPLNFEIYYDPKNELLDDKLFSPALVHLPLEFHYEANNESDGPREVQYGTNETNISDFLNSVVNWDHISYEDSGYHQQSYPSFNFKESVLGSDLDAELANMTFLQAAYPVEAIDRRISLVTTQEFCSNIGISANHSGSEQKNDIELFLNNSEMAVSSNARMGQVYNVVNNYEQPRNFNTDAIGETGIIKRTRAGQSEQLSINSTAQGIAERRIRLSKVTVGSNRMVNSGNCAQEEITSKPMAGVVEKASETHATDETASLANDVKEQQKTFGSTRNRKISRQVTKAGSRLGLKDVLLLRRVPNVSKASFNRTLWFSVLVVSAFVIVLLVAFTDICGCIKI